MPRKTYVINIVSGPGAGKTTICARLFCELKLLGYVVEFVQEYAKTLVWKKEFELLNNQYVVSQEQYKLLKPLVDEVDFIVTDGSLIHGLYYNRFNNDNTSNIEKTEKMIINRFKEFNNIVIFLNRGSFPYEQQGRIQNESEAKQIDTILMEIMSKHNISFNNLDSDIKNIPAFIQHCTLNK